MSTYVIDFSDPLKDGFSITAGGFNGPGGSAANTSLRLYGRGALEWGEAVDEDLVRLTENFASASPPSVAVAGQLWMEVTYYYHNDSLGVLSGWYFYDPNSSLANKWTLVNGTGVVASVAPITPVIGQYYYTPGGSDTATHPSGVLNGYYSLGRYEPATWVSRSYQTGTGAPNASVVPKTYVRVRDAAQSAWVSPSTTTVTGGTAPSSPLVGQLWYNTASGNLLVYTGTVWQEILGPSIPNSSTASAQVDMDSHRLLNLGSPVLSTDAATKGYVDTAVAGAGTGVFLPLTGGTLSVTTSPGLTIHRTNSATNSALLFKTTGGDIYIGQGPTGQFAVDDDSSLNASPWLTATATAFSVAGTLTTGSSATIGSSVTVTTSASVGTSLVVGTTGSFGGIVNMNSNKITNLATGTNANDAVNVSQMNAAIAASNAGASIPVIWSSGAYKAGDIAISSGKIYMAVGAGTGGPPGGNWKQIFPAVYS